MVRERDDAPDPSLEREILDLLHRAGLPRDVDRPLTDEERRRTDAVARAALARIVASPPEGATPTRPRGLLGRRRRRRWVRPLVLGSALTVLATVVALVVLGPGSPGPLPGAGPGNPAAGGPTPAMARFALVSYDDGSLDGARPDDQLRELAALAARQQVSGSGPVQRVTLDSWFLVQDTPRSAALVPTATLRYFLPDGRLRNIERTGAALDAAGHVRPAPLAADPTADETFAGPDQGPDYAAGLPTDPAALVRRLVPVPAECPRLASCLVAQLLDLSYTWVVPPAVTSTLWEALVGQEGVTYLGDTVDRLGRGSVAFAVPTADDDTEIVLYVDPTTGLLQGSDEVLVGSGSDDGPELELPAVRAFTTLTESRLVTAAALP